jgi:hypothetical protein
MPRPYRSARIAALATLAAVNYIVRTHTEGGVAPATGCDKAREGAETRVQYSATYTFF